MYLNSNDLASRHRRSMRTVARWTSDPALAPQGFPKPIKIGRRWLWLLTDIEAWERGLASKVAA